MSFLKTNAPVQAAGDKIYFGIIFFLFTQLVFAQYPKKSPDSLNIDLLYREDQFYVGLTFNLLVNRPNTITQSGFSGGLQAGCIRDMPINKRRNLAFGVGIGYGLHVFNQNLLIETEQTTQTVAFRSLENQDFDRNRFTMHLIEFPLQFRWRTSDASSHKFYRIYTGFQLGYIAGFRSLFRKGSTRIANTTRDFIKRVTYGATFTFGWNTMNFHVYYGLDSIFKEEAKIENQSIRMTPIKIGFMFFIL